MDTQATIHHDWETRVGKAPYTFLTVISFPSTELAEKNPSAYADQCREVSEQARGLGMAGNLGICHVCGMALMNNYVCQNAEGGKFVVGCECVRKLGDTRLTTEVEEAERERQRQLARKRRQERWAAEQAAREAKEREANGGLTNAEVWAKQRQEAEAAAAERAAKAAAENAWLIDVLTQVPTSGDFIPAMIDKLHREPLLDLSGRCVALLADIYAKAVSGSRQGSKAFKAAEARFWELAGVTDVECGSNN
jgi:hypothetical protein